MIRIGEFHSSSLAVLYSTQGSPVFRISGTEHS